MSKILISLVVLTALSACNSNEKVVYDYQLPEQKDGVVVNINNSAAGGLVANSGNSENSSSSEGGASSSNSQGGSATGGSNSNSNTAQGGSSSNNNSTSSQGGSASNSNSNSSTSMGGAGGSATGGSSNASNSNQISSGNASAAGGAGGVGGSGGTSTSSAGNSTSNANNSGSTNVSNSGSASNQANNSTNNSSDNSNSNTQTQTNTQTQSVDVKNNIDISNKLEVTAALLSGRAYESDSGCKYNEEEQETDDGQTICIKPKKVQALQGLNCQLYDLSKLCPSSLPNYDTFTPVYSFTIDQLDVGDTNYAGGFPKINDLSVRSRYLEWYGVRCTGKLVVKKEDTYNFFLTSDDGAIVKLDGTVLVNNDGLHAPSTKSGSRALTKGKHDFQVDYYQGPRTQIALLLEWASSTISKAVIGKSSYNR